MPKRPVLEKILNVLVRIAFLGLVLAFVFARAYTFNGLMILVASLVVFLIAVQLHRKVDG